MKGCATPPRPRVWPHAETQQDADTQPNPRISATFATDAERYEALGEKFDAAR